MPVYAYIIFGYIIGYLFLLIVTSYSNTYYYMCLEAWCGCVVSVIQLLNSGLNPAYLMVGLVKG